MAITLTDARLMGIRFVQPDALDPALKDFPEAEELSFAYTHIEWRWMSPASVASATGADWAPSGTRPRRRSTD
jgi:type VI protein secretion system component Hcp